ncbi:MAG: putative HtrA2 peptidase [Candidatus Saccharibacteria bacterium]|nr:putative HtrA2 peptidase [Candidatus Saccharibacteria bacterium]
MLNPFKSPPKKSSKTKPAGNELPPISAFAPTMSSSSTKPRQPMSVERKSSLATTILMLIVAVAAGFGGGYVGARNNGYDANSAQAKQQIISNESQLVNSIAKNVGASVVSVDVSSQTTTQNIFGISQPQTEEGAGTGVILTKDGLIITNRHVVPAGTTTVSVTLSDGTKLDNVTVVGRTAESDPFDIAFLQIKDLKGKTLTPAVVGDSSKVQVGDKVVAIGNALGQFQNTVTSGIISGYGRSIEAGDQSGSSSTETLQNLFQTDAAINLGNSGGPLVNVNGEVIGINVAIADAQNIGFSIPVNDIKGLIASVEKDGKLERPYLGIRYVTLTDDYAYEYNLDVKRGAYIAPNNTAGPSILPGSPAEKAGLQEKDVITQINGTKIDENNSLVSLLGRFTVGTKVTLTVNRDGKDQKIDVTLEAAPQG